MAIPRSQIASTLDHGVLEKYLKMPMKNLVQVMYVWIDAELGFRCKSKTVDFVPKKASDLPMWNYDGSSTNQSTGKNSDVYIKPIALFDDPFRGGDNKIVLTETIAPDNNPHPTNTRRAAAEAFAKKEKAEPWYGIEQEYTLFDIDGITPFAWPKSGFPAPQGPYYCGVGADKVSGRAFVEAHYRACIAAGVKIAGTNAEVMPSQWEYQIGPCTGIESGDHVMMSRFLAHRVAEDFGIIVNFEPKPIKGDWNGAGCHTNFSTKPMREKGGMKEIQAAIKKLALKHHEHIKVYGKDNDQRLTGEHETASIHDFSADVANRGCSIRIPRQVEADGYGYFEDRRPASNMDPYVVTHKIFDTCVL